MNHKVHEDSWRTGEVVLLKERDQRRDVVLLIVILVRRSDRIGRGSGDSIVVRDVYTTS